MGIGMSHNALMPHGPDEDASEPLGDRVLVRRQGEAKPFACLIRDNGDTLRIDADPTAIAPDDLFETVNAFRLEREGGVACDPGEGWQALLNYVQSRGFLLVNQKVRTASFKFGLDLKTGRLVGEQVGAPTDLAQMVLQSLRDGFQKPIRELADQVTGLVDAGNPIEAVTLVVEAEATGSLALGTLAELLAPLMRIPLVLVPTHAQKAFLGVRVRAASSANDYRAAGADAESLLATQLYDSPTERIALETTRAIGLKVKGQANSALLALKRLVGDPEIDTGGLAWVHRNISVMLPTTEEECERTAQLSSDLFLTVGDRAEAARSLMRVADCRLTAAPTTVVQVLDEIDSWQWDATPQGRVTRAGVLLRRAQLALRLDSKVAAISNARAAVGLLHGLLGGERELSMALGIIIGAGKGCGNDVSQDEALLATVLPIAFEETSAMRLRLSALQNRYDATEVPSLRAALREAGEDMLEALLDVVVAISDASLPPQDKLALVEGANLKLEAGDLDDYTIAKIALGGVLLELGEQSRALEAYRALHSRDPVNPVARQNIPALLFALKRYPEAVRHLEDQVACWGHLPGITLVLGQALLHAGNASRAANIFAGLAIADQLSQDVRKQAGEWRDKALGAGGELSAPEPIDDGVLSRADLEGAISEFAEYVKRQKRMAFWQTDHRDKKWTPKPEMLAKTMLHTFIKGRFGDRVEVIEELAAGAGRIDLFVRLRGGFSAVIELKMLGDPYSSTYAFEGDEQIVHYMDNRACHVGYLVLFDARARDWGLTPDERTAVGQNMVVTTFVDVRPTVKARRPTDDGASPAS